jgi:hypothetical protein
MKNPVEVERKDAIPRCKAASGEVAALACRLGWQGVAERGKLIRMRFPTTVYFARNRLLRQSDPGPGVIRGEGLEAFQTVFSCPLCRIGPTSARFLNPMER